MKNKNKKESRKTLNDISELLILVGIAGCILFSFPLYSCRNFCIDGSCVVDDPISWGFIITPIVLVIIGFILRMIYKKKYK